MILKDKFNFDVCNKDFVGDPIIRKQPKKAATASFADLIQKNADFLKIANVTETKRRDSLGIEDASEQE